MIGVGFFVYKATFHIGGRAGLNRQPRLNRFEISFQVYVSAAFELASVNFLGRVCYYYYFFFL